ncbi:MAG TPA: hypothetical protein PLQ56_20565 [Aggregatilineales bacterium]|nr:hypothetical protein [Anaerolineae bacterium]HUN09011.1 hypothetical protein [Aggregatilineales bacterium]
MTDAALEAQLRRLMDVWAERAAEARRKVEQLRYNDPNQAYRQRGMSEAYLAVIGDIESLLVAPEQPTQPALPVLPFVAVKVEVAIAALQRVGLLVAELHPHHDSSFTLVFSPLQNSPFEDRIARLEKVAQVQVLDYGRLPGSNRTYVDFGFLTPPTA